MSYRADRQRVFLKKIMVKFIKGNIPHLPKNTLEDLLRSIEYYLERDAYNSLAEKEEWEAAKITIKRCLYGKD